MMPKPLVVINKEQTTWRTPISWLWAVFKVVLIIWVVGWIVKTWTWTHVNVDGDTVIKHGWWDDASHWWIGIAIVIPLYIVLYVCAKILDDPVYCCCGPSASEKLILEEGSQKVHPMFYPVTQEMMKANPNMRTSYTEEAQASVGSDLPV